LVYAMLVKPFTLKTDAFVWLALLALVLLWDLVGQDLVLSQQFGTPQGFALKNDKLLQFWFHDVAQNVARLGLLGLLVMIFMPLGWFKALRQADRVHLLVSAVVAAIVVVVLKQLSASSCPWSLGEFGGKGHYVSHWVFGVSDGGGGRCFPGGHSSSGFAYIAAAFWLRSASFGGAKTVFWLASAAGMALGCVQMLRGAHFFSHALWTWVTCWLAGLVYFYAVQAWRAKQTQRKT
jgi:membrane-associated PAP2 superfamily phosphatase